MPEERVEFLTQLVQSTQAGELAFYDGSRIGGGSGIPDPSLAIEPPDAPDAPLPPTH